MSRRDPSGSEPPDEPTASTPSENPAAEAAAFLAAIVVSSDDAIVGKTLDGIVRSWNPGAERVFGYTAKEAIGRHIEMVVPAELRHEEEEILTRIRRGERVDHFETVRVRKDGERIDVSLTISPIRDEEGRIIGASKVARDVTAQKRAEREARRNRQILKAMVDAAPIAISVMDRSGVVHLWNRAAERIFGWSSEEVVGGVTPTVPADRIEELREHIRRTANGEPLDGEETVRRDKRGEPVELALWSAVLPAQEDEEERFLSLAVDITEKRRIERSLIESESRFQILADNIAQLAWMADPEGGIFWYNQRWFEYTGAAPEEMEGWGWTEVQHPDHVDRVVEGFRRAVEAGEQWEDTFPMRRHDGAYRWFLSRALPIRDESGEVLRWFGTNTDITDRIEMEEALRRADRKKNDFLATLAHELRNPLAPIRNGVQLLRRVEEDPDLLPRITETLERQTDHLVRLVDDLMDVSRITRGKIELRRSRIELDPVLEAAIEISEPARDREGHRLEVKLPREQVWIDADPTRLTQVFGNLLTNAAKYTPAGGELRLEAEASDGEAVIRVVDSGEGIPAGMLGEIFEPFVQVGADDHESRAGLGIGLTLVRSLVALHGGRIHARSGGPGEGSEFEVRLPRADPPPDAVTVDPGREEADSGSDGSLRILVVDDNRDAADALADLLEMEGHRSRAVYDGESALEVGEELDPDAVILDLGMPDVDGYETARRLRETDWGREVLLLALTGWGKESDRERTRANGFDHHLVKPADIDTLIGMLAEGDRRPSTDISGVPND